MPYVIRPKGRYLKSDGCCYIFAQRVFSNKSKMTVRMMVELAKEGILVNSEGRRIKQKRLEKILDRIHLYRT